jgi:hypothetical protein
MRLVLLVIGCLCVFIGAEFLVVDKVVLHDFSSNTRAERGVEEPGARVIDLPDLGGYLLVAGGAACIMFSLALGRQEPKK